MTDVQLNRPEDYVIATGKQHRVREFVELAAHDIELSLAWHRVGEGTKAYDSKGRSVVAVDPR